ncbi:MAG: type II toxin-antitoxin system HicB family antitoxin [Dehalococcoidales bacterium]
MNRRQQEYQDLPYSNIIVPDVTTNNEPCYMAYHPELEGCMSHGSTQEEALKNLKEVTELYISTLINKGLDVPVPQGGGIIWDIVIPTIEPEAQRVPSITQPVFEFVS